jgi:DNA-directed RNA polymerase subunit RPC12/RpoP
MELKCKKCGNEFEADDVDFYPNDDKKYEFMETVLTCNNCGKKYFTRITPDDLIED